MPRGDETGPIGMGPMTGKGMGCCAGYAVPGHANRGFGMGRGWGFRRMHMAGLPGWARCAPDGCASFIHQGTVPEAGEKKVLENHADFLEEQLKKVRERLKGFEETE